MLKRILAGAMVAAMLVGCGGNGSGGGSSNVYGVNACPGVGGLSITANGTVVLSNAAFDTTSSSFVAVNSGNTAQVFVTNASSTQLASGTTNFLAGAYYHAYAFGSLTNQYLVVLPIDVTPPNSGTGRLVFSNTSILAASCDVYVTTNTSLVGLTPTVSGLNPFNSGFQTEFNNVAPNTYNVYFTAPGNPNNVLVQTSVTVTDNTIQTIGITDTGNAAAPFQQALPLISDPVVSGSNPPAAGTKNFLIGPKLKV